MSQIAIAAITALSLALASCDRPPNNQQGRTFATEDDCEDAGMSDAFCDRLFPEWEDFKKKRKKTTTSVLLKPNKPNIWGRAGAKTSKRK